MMTQGNLNVNGGSSTARYFVSLGYLKQDGLYKYDDLNAYNINAVISLNNLNFKLTKSLSRSVNYLFE
ncbi:hypothetical protein [Mucilaginibacter sp.]|uniref:hypothetical protein n=1 Tax=Mucilaginibacter sp. TaxID=1882438 RepID=UPI00261CE396|nr:hypothetical protein [Mucilaginibacter sp.]